MIWGYVGDNGCKLAKLGVDGSGAVFNCEDGNRGDPTGEDGGGGEGVEVTAIAKSVGKLVDGAGIDSVSRSDDSTRAIALLMISVMSSSVNRSRENTLYLCQAERLQWKGVTRRHRLSNAPFSLKDGFSVVAPMSFDASSKFIHRHIGRHATYLNVAALKEWKKYVLVSVSVGGMTSAL